MPNELIPCDKDYGCVRLTQGLICGHYGDPKTNIHSAITRLGWLICFSKANFANPVNSRLRQWDPWRVLHGRAMLLGCDMSIQLVLSSEYDDYDRLEDRFIVCHWRLPPIWYEWLICQVVCNELDIQWSSYSSFYVGNDFNLRSYGTQIIHC